MHKAPIFCFNEGLILQLYPIQSVHQGSESALGFADHNTDLMCLILGLLFYIYCRLQSAELSRIFSSRTTVFQ
mgnify:CR=1 FL=1